MYANNDDYTIEMAYSSIRVAMDKVHNEMSKTLESKVTPVIHPAVNRCVRARVKIQEGGLVLTPISFMMQHTKGGGKVPDTALYTGFDVKLQDGCVSKLYIIPKMPVKHSINPSGGLGPPKVQYEFINPFWLGGGGGSASQKTVRSRLSR